MEAVHATEAAMSAEDWLRERGIEISRQQRTNQPGQYARYPTSALPGALPGADIEDQETQAVPSIVRLDLHIGGGDITEWPTGKLDEDALLADAIAEGVPDLAAPPDDNADLAFVDEATMIMPIVPMTDITRAPTRRLTDVEEQ